MASLNKVSLLGRVGQKPEKGQSQNAPVNLSLATHEVWRDKQGNKQEDLQWHRIVVWGKQGDNVLQYVNKGDLLYVEGKLQTESYEKNGQKMFATKIVAREVKFLTPKGSGQTQTQGQRQAPSNYQTQPQSQYQQGQVAQFPPNNQQPPMPQQPPMDDIPW